MRAIISESEDEHSPKEKISKVSLGMKGSKKFQLDCLGFRAKKKVANLQNPTPNRRSTGKGRKTKRKKHQA